MPSGSAALSARRPPQDAPVTRPSWYSAASWKSKASPTAQVARESISVAQGVSSESSSKDDISRRPSQSVSKSFKGSNRKSVPLVAEETRVYAVPDPASQPEKPPSAENKVAESAPLPPEPQTAPAEQDAKTETANMRPSSGSWFGWWSRPDGDGSDAEMLKSKNKAALEGMAVEQASDTPLPETPEVTPAENAETVRQGDGIEDAPSELAAGEMSTNTRYNSTRSWFGLWSKAQKEQAQKEHAAEDEQQRQGQADVTRQPDPVSSPPSEQLPPAVQISAERESTSQDLKAGEVVKLKSDADRPRSSGWAFWSKEKPQETSNVNNEETQKQVGEIAVADTPSQSHPEAAQYNEQRDPKAEVKRGSSLLRRGRKQKPTDISGDTTAAATPSDSHAQTPAFFTPNDTPEGSPAPVQRGKLKQTAPNLVLPTFRDTYPCENSPGYLNRLTQYIGHSLHLSQPAKPAQHPYILQQPHKVRRAVAIGVHGYFPAALVQRVLGAPTGTSIRFANFAAASIKQWCVDHQPEVKDVQIEKVALEGEGLVRDRVNTLWRLLLNWLTELRQADFIMVACHSQGVPVATLLVQKLFDLACLNPTARIGICAMAGINLGPFPEYNLRFFGGSALELFDFSDRKSKVSVAYSEALDTCLRHGVRITYVGGLDDQLVSLESSLHAPLSHPYVNRTIFVDGQLHTSNFLIHLVIFAAKLRNLGVSDHGLLREISAPLAGSIVSGAGHSRVYDDPAVYRTAIEFALESTLSRRGSNVGYPTNMTAANHMRRGSLGSSSLAPPGIAPIMGAFEPAPLANAAEKNPFVLPWAVRGMLEEELVKKDPKLQLEVKELVKEFEEWRPSSKALKDVRWRLEGVRSML
ncbi:hypothetical protein CERZMDRAFT_33406 [Cercospora zeae-maydis SCOH1-5]|uniref:YMC020W-like alpha/beta hydrolase domain-containing protein n=1 Tax=Cercospora zeae-maydis SCOH1-5 TaxID=717836 RepID=A0A6A6FSG3_9PEZI|nr:hypothetical protein CERZMDRAFT_33406 [Cercospora zeae-maydis SCOH1-5]